MNALMKHFKHITPRLNGWRVDQREDPENATRLYLIGQTPRERISISGTERRAQLFAIYPAHLNGCSVEWEITNKLKREFVQVINVNPTRPPQTVANDIERRLLTPYRETLEQLKPLLDADRARVDQLQLKKQLINRMIGCSRDPGDYNPNQQRIAFSHHACSLSGEIVLTLGGTSNRLDIRFCDDDLIMRLAATIGQYEREKAAN